jgi:hypothetical protein
MKAHNLALPVLGALTLILNGCIDITTRLQPEDTSVKEALYGEDCVPIIMGFGFGTATAEQAMMEAGPDKDFSTRYTNGQHITKIRRVESNEAAFLFAGHRCVRVVGE